MGRLRKSEASKVFEAAGILRKLQELQKKYRNRATSYENRTTNYENNNGKIVAFCRIKKLKFVAYR